MLYVTVTRGVDVSSDTVIDADMLNRLGQPIVQVTGTIDGTGSITITPGSITTNKLEDATTESNGVTNAKLAFMPASSIKGNKTGSSAAADDLTVAEVKDLLEVTAYGALEHFDNAGTGSIRVKAQGIQNSHIANASIDTTKLNLQPSNVVTATTANLVVSANLIHNCEPTGDATYTLVWSANDNGKTVLVRVKAPTADSDVTFANSGEISLVTRWKGDTVPTLVKSLGKVDLFVFTRIANSVYCSAVQSFNG